MKNFLLFTMVAFLLLVSNVQNVYSQERTVTGKVISAENGDPLPGVNVVEKGTTNGTITDVDGNYRLTLSGESNVLVFSFVGLESQEVNVGARSVVDVQMASNLTELSEVVVTALGITREKAALGYGVTKVENDLIEKRGAADVGRVLRGKVPGVDIQQTSGLNGTGTNIVIRGFSTISGGNQPLFVVDGVPFNGDTNADRGFQSGGATASSRFLDLDPNNIAEISVLKGLSATVLYGEAGKNGVVLITTKTNSRNAPDSGFEVSLDQQVTFSEVANIPDYQDSYGNGFSGNFGWFFSNWGPSFDVRGSNGIATDGTIPHPYDQERYHDDFPEFEGARVQYEPHQSVENFYQTGIASNTSIGIDKNFGTNGSVRLNYSNLSDNGIIPEDKNLFRKDNFSLGGRTLLDNGLTLNTTFNYVTSKRISPPAAVGAGSNPSGASLFGNLLYTPRSVDLLGLPYQSPIDGSMVYYRRGSAIQNPLWTLHNASDEEKIKRYFGQVSLLYEITDWMNFTYRLGVDQYSQQQRRRINKGGSQVPDGYMATSERLNTITDHVFNLSFNRAFNEDFDFNGVIGFNMRRETRDQTLTESTEQFLFDLFTHNNFTTHIVESYIREENTLGAYATATFGYKNYLYLNFQGRNDWTSTLEKENRSVIYPSGSISFIPTDAFPGLQNDYIDYMKVRFGYGTSAGYPEPYRTRSILATGTNVFVNQNGDVFDVHSVSNVLGNPNLTPEIHTEMEFGFEGRFWQNRVGVDLSLYDKSSEDLIIDLDLDPATGYTETTVNAAAINNKGVELQLNLIPVRGDLTWEITPNYTKNMSKVETIYPGVDQVPIKSYDGDDGFDGVGNWAIPGEPYGVLQGTGYERRNGEILVGADGIPVPKQDKEIIGNPNPDWLGNISSTLTWKGLSLYILWSYQSGGDIYSISTATLLARGNTVDTDFDRFIPVIFPGVKEDVDGNIVENDIQAYIGDVSFRAYFFANEGGIFDATHLRFREATLSYELPPGIIERTPFGSVSLRLTGQNLWVKSFNFPEGVNYDPEVLSTGVGNTRGMEFITGPTTRRYGVGLSITL